jgi:hypothetical protein
MSFKPWHQLTYPREDLRIHQPLDAAEFAVHLEQVRDERAPDDYQIPRIFFERTYLTHNLTQLASEVIRRLSGKVHGANAVFNLTTQFGGGKTHALTLLYHLATHGPESLHWFGVERLLHTAEVESIPRAATAVFVGTEFDSLKGRGGDDGTPLRKTPWGEIAYQLRGAEGFRLVAEHDHQLIAPAGDVIRELLPADQPCLILMDELINYMSRNRSQGLANQLYNFLQSLADAVLSREKAVLVVSLPKAANEMSQEDESDYQRFIKLLGRVSKPVAIASETEVSEIIRRRLFEWDSRAVSQDGRIILGAEAKAVCKAYAEWTIRYRSLLTPDFPFDHAQQEFEATYPFHPAVISLFQRKWRSLPQFQQTRGILKLLAQWVSEVYQHRSSQRDALITLGTAPLDILSFRDFVVSEQLGEDRLKAVVTTDISGREDAHASSLDRQAEEEIRNRRLHRKIATTILFESNGGQANARASLAEIRLAVGEPDLEVGEIEPALERLLDACYYLSAQGQKYSFSVRANLNKLLADRRATIASLEVEDRVRQEVEVVFAKGPTLGLDRKYFPTVSTDIPNRPLLTLVVVAPEQPYQSDEQSEVRKLIKKLTIEHGESYRTFKNALIWCVADPSSTPTLYTEARKLLALQAIEQDEHAEFDETQTRQITDARKRAERDLREAVWRSYRYLLLLDKENNLREIDLGLVHSSAAHTLAELILRELRQAGEVVDTIGVNYLLRNWPAAFPEWSTKAVREAVFGSPRFPRLLHLDSLRATFAQGVASGQMAYVGKANGKYDPFYYKTTLRADEIEFSDEMFLITGETAEAYLAAQAASAAFEETQAAETTAPEALAPSRSVSSGNGAIPDQQTQHVSVQVLPSEGEPGEVAGEYLRKLTWRGEIPAQKWTTFYLKVLSRFATGSGLKLTLQMDLSPEGGISRQKLEETRIALRELGLPEEMLEEES